ncbi:MAG: cupin domain-containing protein [Ferruginibacter sp.]
MENNATKKLFIEDNDLVAENAGEGITRKVIAYNEKLMLVKLIFQKGAIGPIHQHHHTQISYIEEGVFEVTINDEKKVLNTGNSFFVPPGALHGVCCLEDGVLIDVFSPMREDYI